MEEYSKYYFRFSCLGFWALMKRERIMNQVVPKFKTEARFHSVKVQGRKPRLGRLSTDWPRAILAPLNITDFSLVAYKNKRIALLS